MKTISSPSEYGDVLSKSNAVVTCVPSKATEDNHQGQNNIFDCENQGDSEEKKNLIVCDSNLTSNLQIAKYEKSKISPGHYLQKVFFNYTVAQKLKSQSLPNCVPKKKYPENSESKDICGGLLTNEVAVNDTVCEIKERDICSRDVDCEDSVGVGSYSDSWFKTWPERSNGGIEKQPFKSNDDYSSVSYKNISFGDNSVNDSKKPGVRTTTDKSELGNPHLQKPVEGVCRAANYGNSAVHISHILDTLPLVYSPVTKQLHVLKTQVSSDGELQNNCTLTCRVNCDNGSNATSNVEKCFFNCDTGNTAPAVNCTGSCNDNFPNSKLTHIATDASSCSYSSTVSSLSDVSPSTNEDSALGSLFGLDHGDSCSIASIGECSILSEDYVAAASTSTGLKQKKKSFSGFFSRNVFGWKNSADGDGDPSQHSRSGGMASSNVNSGWKLFNRSNTTANTSISHSGLSGYESGGGSATPGSPCSVRSSSSVGCGSTNSSRFRSHENVVASSMALIQLDRPPCLPAKSQHELEKHRQQYQNMVDAAKKKELKEAKHRKRQLQLQLRIEEQQAQAARIWSQEILPKWETMCNSRKARELWWMGIPPCVRGKIWRLAIPNELNLTLQLFDICCLRARDMLNTVDVHDNSSNESTDNKEASVQLIQLDISRTFPNLCIFQQGGPYYDMLHCLLGAYVCYRPDVGYVQGMSFIAAVLILNMDVSDAFICFANLLNRPCLMAFFSLNQPLMQAYYATYNDLLHENLPHVHKHFVGSHLTPDLYLLDWIYTVFTKAMNLDLACRVWDVFLRDGEEFLFKAALGVLHLCQDSLLKMDFVHGSQYLTRLPDDLPADQLFKSINNIKMNVGKQTFEQILAFHSQELGSSNINQ